MNSRGKGTKRPRSTRASKVKDKTAQLVDDILSQVIRDVAARDTEIPETLLSLLRSSCNQNEGGAKVTNQPTQCTTNEADYVGHILRDASGRHTASSSQPLTGGPSRSSWRHSLEHQDSDFQLVHDVADDGFVDEEVEDPELGSWHNLDTEDPPMSELLEATNADPNDLRKSKKNTSRGRKTLVPPESQRPPAGPPSKFKASKRPSHCVEDDGEPAEQEDSQAGNANHFKWSDEIEFDEMEEVEMRDREGKRGWRGGRILPRNVWSLPPGARFVVPFNDLDQPIRKGGHVLVRFLEDVVKTGELCPIGDESWLKVDRSIKANIIAVVREKFLIPAREEVNKNLLRHVANNWRFYRDGLKVKYKTPGKTQEQVASIVPEGVVPSQWTKLVEYWFSDKSQDMASTGNSITKQKIISRNQCLSSLGRKMTSTRQSPRFKQVATESTDADAPEGTSARRSLFPKKPTSQKNQTNAVNNMKRKLQAQKHNNASKSARLLVDFTNSGSEENQQVHSCHSTMRSNGGTSAEKGNNVPQKEPIGDSTARHSIEDGNNVQHNKPTGDSTTMRSIGGDDVDHDTPSIEVHTSQMGYNMAGRRRVRATQEKNEKGRGYNKMKVLKDPIKVDVNEDLQPIGDSSRKMSSLIGCLARDPRNLPLECDDWRKIPLEKKEAIWSEVKHSYYFPEGREPYKWALEKMNACWRGYKSELKVACFDGRTHDEAISKKPDHIPEETWAKLIEFWESYKGKERTKAGIENRANLKMAHYAGSKSFARLRAEEEEKGNKLDKLTAWFMTHSPKKGSKLDDASAATKLSLENELALLKEGSVDVATRDKIFEKVVGEDKHGYAKTYGMGRKVPRFNSKMGALEEERAKRKKIEVEHKESQQKINNLEKKLGKVTDLLKILVKREGLSDNLLLSLEDDAAESENEHEFEDIEGQNDEEYDGLDNDVEDQDNDII